MARQARRRKDRSARIWIGRRRIDGRTGQDRQGRQRSIGWAWLRRARLGSAGMSARGIDGQDSHGSDWHGRRGIDGTAASGMDRTGKAGMVRARYERIREETHRRSGTRGDVWIVEASQAARGTAEMRNDRNGRRGGDRSDKARLGKLRHGTTRHAASPLTKLAPAASE